MWSKKNSVAGRDNVMTPTEAMFMKNFKLVLLFIGLWSPHPKYLGTCNSKHLFDAYLHLQELIG